MAALAVTAKLVMVKKKRNALDWGFKDVVKTPDYWEIVSQAQQEFDVVLQFANRWSDNEVASVTRQFVLDTTSSRDVWGEARILRELGERTYPALALLRDPSLYDRLVTPTGENILPEAPFNRACDLFGDSPPSAAIEALAPFLNDHSEQIRKDAALAIAKTGDSSISPHFRKAFSDADEYVRSYALMGLDFTLNRSSLARNLQEELFPDVLALLRTGRNADQAAVVLCRLDEEKATEFFLSEEAFTADSPILHETLKTLANGRVPVPRNRLQGLIASLEAKKMKYPITYALGEALRLLGQQQRDEDRDFLCIRMTHTDGSVACGAAAGLVCSFGLEGFEERTWDIERRSGYASLTRQQRLYSAVVMCHAEINNGGLAQYFVNSSGDHWPDAIAGFMAMGFKERRDVLSQAIAFFGKDGPSTDRSTRHKQLSILYRCNDTVFEELESR